MESRRLWVARSEAILYTLLNLEQKHPLRGAKVQIDSGHMKTDGPGHKGTAVQKEETPRAAVKGFREEGTGPWEAGRDSGSSTGTGVMLRSHQTGSAGEKRFIQGVGVGGRPWRASEALSGLGPKARDLHWGWQQAGGKNLKECVFPQTQEYEEKSPTSLEQSRAASWL